MRELSQAEYEDWRSSAEITASDHHGDKVLRLADGTYLKLFRVKRLITSARFFPYWRRFQNNAEQLADLGIPTLRVKEVLAVPHLARTAVHYEPLPGQTLREVDELSDELVLQLGHFLTVLHDKGVYLRSLHLGNVVMTPEGELGLIDIADMRIRRGPLSHRLRVRNYHHLCRYEEDRVRVAPFTDEFLADCDPKTKLKVAEMLAG